MRTEEALEEGTFSRQDAGGKWHSVASAPCEECGCLYDYSIDTPGVIWEAGPNIGGDCLDDMCECHLMPVEGLPFKINFLTYS